MIKKSEQAASRKRRSKERETLNKLTPIRNKCKAYIEDGKRKELIKHFDGEISPATLKKIIDTPELALTGYSIPKFMALGKLLPPLNSGSAQAYQFIRKELGTDIMSTDHLEKFKGSYRIFSNFNHGTVEMGKSCRIAVFPQSQIPYYLWPYRFGASQKEGKKQYEMSDGFLFGRHGKIYLVGLSSRSTLFASFQGVENPEREMLFGTGSFSDPEIKNAVYSQIVMSSKAKLSPEDEEKINNHLSKGIGEV